mmetsp:Transcript_113016/g.205527  ORF Transcript_113016/g.205527 Transcript_113016/m.205527 type:complete len:582 (+) Transcript_113016:99-1844(+)
MLDFDENSVDAPDWYDAFEKALGIESNDEALSLAKDAVAYCKEDFDEVGEAIALCAVARASLAKGDAKGARRACDQALKAAKEVDSMKAEAAALHALAKLGEPGSPGKAEEALEAYKSLDDKAGEAAVMLTMAQIHRTGGDFDMAMDTAKQAQQIFEAMGSSKGQASALYVQFLTQLCLRRMREAHSTLNDMLSLYMSEQDLIGQSNVHLLSAQLLLSQNRTVQAMDAVGLVVEAAQTLGDRRKQATAYYLLAKMHGADAQNFGNPSSIAFNAAKAEQAAASSMEHAEAAWSVFREVRDKAGQAASLSLIADHALATGDKGSAALKYEEVAFLQRSLKDTLEEGRALRKLSDSQLRLCKEKDGTITISQGDVKDPEKNARRAVELLQQAGRAGERELAQGYITLVRVLSMMGEVEQALEATKIAQKFAYELGDDSNEATAWLEQGKVLLMMGLRSDGVQMAEKAQTLAEGLNPDVEKQAQDLIEKNSKKKPKKATGPVEGLKTDINLQWGKVYFTRFKEQEARVARHMTKDHDGGSSSMGPTVGLKLEDIIAPKDSNIMYNMKWSESVQVSAPKPLDSIVA